MIPIYSAICWRTVSDEVIVLSAACCFVRRNLTRIQDYFEQNLPRYLPDEFDNSASPDVKKHAEY